MSDPESSLPAAAPVHVWDRSRDGHFTLCGQENPANGVSPYGATFVPERLVCQECKGVLKLRPEMATSLQMTTSCIHVLVPGSNGSDTYCGEPWPRATVAAWFARHLLAGDEPTLPLCVDCVCELLLEGQPDEVIADDSAV